MYSLKESKLSLVRADSLELNYSFEVLHEKPIRFKRESLEESSHRTHVSIKLQFVFLDNKLDFNLNDELIESIIKKNDWYDYYKVSITLSIKAKNTVFQNITIQRERAKGHKGVTMFLNLQLDNCKFNFLKMAVDSRKITLVNVKCNDLLIDGNPKEFEAVGIKAKNFRLSSCSEPIVSNFIFETLAVGDWIKKIKLSQGVIKKEIRILENTNDSTEKNIDFNISFVNLKNATDSKISVIRMIKKQLELRGNNYDYLNTLACEYKITKSKLNFWESPTDYIQLLLNEMSNNFGTSWFKGVYFTFAINFIGSWALYCSILHDTAIEVCQISLETDVKSIFFNNFSPIYRNDLLERLSATSLLSYSILFFTKIFVFYGIYQTVFAFRKYKK